MKFAKHRNVGEILALVFDSFGITNNGVDSKRFERFSKQSEISASEYSEILNISVARFYRV